MEALRAWDKIFSFRSVTVFVLFHSDWTHQLSYCVNRIPRWKGCGHSPLNMYAVRSKGTWWLSVGGSASLKNTAGVCGQDLQVHLTKPLLCWFSHYPFGDEYTKTTTLNPDGMFTICSLLEAPSQELLSCRILQSGPEVTGQEIGGPAQTSAVYWKYHLIPAALSGPSFPSFHSEDMLT